MKDFLSTLLTIALCFASIVGVCLGIDYITGSINKSLFKTSYNNPSFHYRIKNTHDLGMDVLHSSKNFFVQQFASDSAKVYVAALALTQDNPDSDMTKRYTYRYAEMLDTVCFPALKQFELIKEEKPLFSWRITRDYSCGNTEKFKTVTIFAREYVYVFIQQYDTSPYLLERLVDNFKSSRTFCFQNIKAVWLDRISVKKFMVLVSYILNIVWAFTCFLLCLWVFLGISEHINNSLIWFACMFLFVLLFSYLVLHDSFMDWLMSYDTFIKIPAQLFMMFFGED